MFLDACSVTTKADLVFVVLVTCDIWNKHETWNSLARLWNVRTIVFSCLFNYFSNGPWLPIDDILKSVRWHFKKQHRNIVQYVSPLSDFGFKVTTVCVCASTFGPPQRAKHLPRQFFKRFLGSIFLSFYISHLLWRQCRRLRRQQQTTLSGHDSNEVKNLFA